MTTTTDTKSVFTVWDAIHEIAIMLEEEGYTSHEVREAARTLRRIKSRLWEAERFTTKDSTKVLGTNIWSLAHAADEMDRIFGTIIMSEEAEDDLASDMDDTDTDDLLVETDDTDGYEEPRMICDGDPGQLLGEFSWQYDEATILDMLSEYDAGAQMTYWLPDDETPDWETIEAAAILPVDASGIEAILDWYNERNRDGSIFEVDDDLLDELTVSAGGVRVWKDIDDSQVESLIEEHELLASDESLQDADDIDIDDDDDLWDIYQIMTWADVWPTVDLESDEGRMLLNSAFYAITAELPSGMRVWKPLGRKEVHDVIVRDVMTPVAG